MKVRKILLPTVLGVVAGPLQLGVIYLLIGKNETNNLFVFLGLLIAFAFVYKIFIYIFYWVTLKGNSSDEREEFRKRTFWISKASFLITYFILLHYISEEGIIVSVIIAFLMMELPILAVGLILAPFVNLASDNNENTNQFHFKRVYLKDNIGNIVGTADTVDYKGKYGSFENTEYKDNFGNVILKQEKR